MAKWGEGDPRWIVEERPDATNVNNWHWTEKNAGPWSQDKIRELFNNHVIKTGKADLKITEVEKCEGEASANNRKGKLIFFYEWDIHLKWSGTLKDGSGTKYKGTVKIPNVSEENDVSEYDIQVSVKDDDEEGEKLKSIMNKEGVDAIRQQLSKYIAGLKEEFTKGMILPKKDEVSTKPVNNVCSKKLSTDPVVQNKTQTCGTKIDTSTINLVQKLQCRAQEFYDAMTRIEMVTAFTRGPVKLDATKRGKFELFGGNITGEFTELEPGKKISQTWRLKQWPAGHYSQVTFTINEKSDHTEVSLTQTGVPAAEAEITKENWQRYYWDAMKQTFGFGAFFTS